MTIRQFATHLKTAIINWWGNDPFTQSAAVAYYTIFSFPALMILYFAVASIFVDQDQLQLQTFQFLNEKFGANAAENFGDIIEKSAPKETNLWAFAIGGFTLLFAGLRLFMQFQKALNHIWETDETELKGIKPLWCVVPFPLG